MLSKLKGKKGFTLIEMLVVIAIIAVLVAIIVPVVSNSTKKAKAATDAANLRSAMAEAEIAALNDSISGQHIFEKTEVASVGTVSKQNNALKLVVSMDDSNKITAVFTDTDKTETITLDKCITAAGGDT